jgi:uncharacterized protein YndB with AHSA1/START domain
MLIEALVVAAAVETVPAPSERAIRKEVVVSAAPAEVWRAWTTNEGAQTFFAPRTDIDPAVGGHYEVYFFPQNAVGSRGAEGCRVHSIVPPTSLAFTWNQPPAVPLLRAADVKTIVFVRLEEAGPGKTRVRFSQIGWGEGPDWDKAFAYFESAWDVVLGRLKVRFESGPIDWSNPPSPTASLAVR